VLNLIANANHVLPPGLYTNAETSASISVHVTSGCTTSKDDVRTYQRMQ